MRQRTLFKLKDYSSEFGGSLLNNKRRSERPFSRKNPLKIVLKAAPQFVSQSVSQSVTQSGSHFCTQPNSQPNSRDKGLDQSRRLARSRQLDQSLQLTQSHLLTRFRKPITDLFNKFSKDFNVKLYELAICGDHIHFVALFPNKDSYVKFIKALTGTIARKHKIKFKFRPWSRILVWGRALKIAIKYTLQNHLESIGAIPYQPRAKVKDRILTKSFPEAKVRL